MDFNFGLFGDKSIFSKIKETLWKKIFIYKKDETGAEKGKKSPEKGKKGPEKGAEKGAADLFFYTLLYIVWSGQLALQGVNCFLTQGPLGQLLPSALYML